MMPRRSYHENLIFLVIFMILGLVLALQIRTNLKLNQQKPSAAYAAEDLKRQLEKQKAANEALKLKIKENEAKNDQYLKAAVSDKGSEAMNERMKELEDVKLKAGLTDVQGQGIVIKMDDAPARTDENPNVLIIHDSDVLKVLNELKKAGAQAIAINGERIIATSESVCAGPTISVNKRRYAVPYVISAIGNADRLYEELSKSQAISLMVRDKIRVDITKLGKLVIPKYNYNSEKSIKGAEVLER